MVRVVLTTDTAASPRVHSASVRALLALAWPMVVARSSQAVIGFSDALMSASLGEAALAAVTTGSLNTFSIVVLPMGLVFITQSFAAQLMGQGRPEVAVRYAWYALALSGVTLLVAVASIPFVEWTLGALGYEAEVHRFMTDYLEIRMLGVGAAIGIEALGSWYGGVGNTRLQMVAGVVAMVANVFLNWVLIFGNLGAPALGVAGAAWASVIATWIGFGVIAFAFGAGYGVEAPSVRPVGLRMSELWRMLRFGLPHGMNWFLEFAAFALFINVIVAQLGTTVLAAMMVVMNINSVSFMPAIGVASAGAILTGQAIGRRDLDSVKHIVVRTLAVTLVWMGSVGLLYLAAPDLLVGWFAVDSSSGALLLEIGAVMLTLSAAWQLFDAVGLTFSEALRSAGDTTWTMWARLTIAWFVFTPAAYAAVKVFHGGHVAVMLAVVGYLLILAVVLYLRFRSGAWRKIDLTGIEPQLLPT